MFNRIPNFMSLFFMETPNFPLLEEKFSNLLFAVEKIEKAQAKSYRKMVKSAFTDELSKCLDPVSTDHLQHLQRLKLINKSVKVKPSVGKLAKTTEVIHYKKPSFQQDIEIIETALKCQHEKLALYEFLHPLAVNLKVDIAAEMIQQTIVDNRNTNKWLRQITQNIIVPSLAVDEEIKS